MARSKEQMVCRLKGKTVDGAEKTVGVKKVGRDYVIEHDFRTHLCHPVVKDIEGVRHEVAIVFKIFDTVIEP